MTSPGARYSAGTAFLDVIPSFRGVQEAIGRHVRDMERALGKEAGDEFGKNFEKESSRAIDKALGTTKESARKHGKEAADEYAGQFATRFSDTVNKMNREMGRLVERNYKVDVELDDKKARERFNNLRREIRDLSKAKIGIDLDAGSAMIQLDRIQKELKQFQDKSVSLEVRTNLGQVIAQVETFRKEIQRDAKIHVEVEMDAERQIGKFERALKDSLSSAMKNFPPIQFDADVTPAQERLMVLRSEMIALGDKRIGIDIDPSEALAEMERLRRELALIATNEDLHVQVRTDAAAAAKDLLAIRALAKMVDETKVDINVELKNDKSLAARLHSLRDSLTGVNSDGQDAANGFRAFNAVTLIGAALLPGLVPVIGALGGALALIGPLALGAAAGLGVMALGFSGIKDAVSGITKVQENAAKDADAAAKKMRTASRSVEDAEQSLGRAREQAGRAAKDAARQVADAVDAQRSAEEDLVRAQRDVIRAQEDVNRAREEAKDRIEDLRLSIMGGALAEREAILDLADAQREYDASLSDPEATAEDRERLLIDLEQQKLQVERLGIENGRLAEQQQEVARTGVEGSQEVVSAQERVAQANEGVQSAMAAVSDAARGVQDAIESQRQTNIDSANSIHDAQERLTEAQENYSTALYETGTLGSESMQALETAMGKLGPAGQAFAYFWAGLLPQFRELRNLVQEGMFPGLQEAISDILTVNGPLLATFMSNMGATLGNLFREFGDMMTSPQWMGIWATFSQYAPIFMQQFGDVALAMLTFFGELFQALAPYAERFGDALVGLAQASAEWMAGFVDSQTFRDIMEWLFTNGPVVFEALWEIAKAIGNILIALEPLGFLVLGMIENFAKWINGMDPKTLGVITTTILGLVVAFQLAAGALALVSGVFAILTSPIALIIFLIGAVVTGLIVLYTQSETFRDIVDRAFHAIGEVATWLWDNVLKYIFQWIVFYWTTVAEVILWAYDNIWKPTFLAIAGIALWLWDNVLKPTFDAIGVAWNVLATGFMWVWDNILHPLWDIWVDVMQVLYAVIVVGLFGAIAAAWWALSNGFRVVYDGFLKPLWEAWRSNLQELWDWMSPLFDWIGDKWNDMLTGMQYVYDQVIYPYIIKPFMEKLHELQGAFEVVVDAIGTAWGWLRETLAMPINFVIETILNKGLFGAFNWIIDTLHLPSEWRIKDWDPIKVDGKIPRYYAGGPVGGWSPHDKADNIPAMLTANEYVQPVDTTRHYGVDVMDAIRKKKIPREVLSQYARYANGGLVGGTAFLARPENRYGAQPRIILPANLASGGQLFAVIKSHFPKARLNDGYRPGANDYHGRDMAVDLGEEGFSGGSGRPYLAAMGRWIYDNFHNSSELIYDGSGDDRPDIKNGKDFTYSADLRDQHKNHVHWAQAGTIEQGLSNSNFVGSAIGAVGDTIHGIWDSVTGVFNSLKDSIVTPVKDFLTHVGDSPMGKIVSAMPGKAVDWLWSKAKDMVTSIFEGGSDTDASVSNVSGPVQDQVKAVFSTRSWDTDGQWNAVANIIAKESGWNPKAQNPSSTASGLFQHINATWRSYRPAGAEKYARMADAPVGMQALAGRDYIASRYGSPVDAWAYWQSHHNYSEGGQVTDPNADAPTLYDTGGWLPPGITTVLNATNKPEPILTNQQWEELTAGRGPESNAPLVGAYHQTVISGSPREAMDELVHTLDVVDLGGRYRKDT